MLIACLLVFNNVIIQWGTTVSGKNTYPISYTTVSKVALGGEYSWQGSDTRLTATYTTYFQCAKSTFSNYIAIGY